MNGNFDFNFNSKRLTNAWLNYENEIISARQELAEIESTEYIRCKKCNKRSQVKKFEYSIFYFYEKPHGCTDGDRWHEAGFYLKCPKCGTIDKINKPPHFANKNEKKKYSKFYNLIESYAIKYEDVYENKL